MTIFTKKGVYIVYTVWTFDRVQDTLKFTTKTIFPPKRLELTKIHTTTQKKSK